MPPVENLIAFFGAVVLLALTPGPDNIFVLTQAALHGRSAGLSVVFGLCTGLIAHTLAVALGLAAILKATPTAFTAIKLLGAIYLFYLAVMAWRAADRASTLSSDDPTPRLSDGVLYRRGIIMNLTNPKVSLFFLAFMPEFISLEQGHLFFQFVALGLVFIAATILVFGGIALAAGTIGSWLRSAKSQAVMNRVTAVILAGLGSLLLLD